MGRQRLRFDAAGIGPARTLSRLVVQLRTADTVREIYNGTAIPGEWRSESVSIEERGLGTLVLASEGAAAWSGVRLLGSGSSRRPNLVLISIDTLRSDHLSGYGYGRHTSPNLDRLAGDGYLFRNSTSASTWTLPSTGTLLTGLLPDQHRLRSIHDALSPEVPTIAEILRDAGYGTTAFTDGGFVGFRWGFPRGFQRFDSTAGQAWDPKDVAAISTAATKWLESDPGEPFFLFVHTYETHSPYTNLEGFADPYLDPGYTGSLGERIDAFDLMKPTHRRPEDRERAVAFYDGEIARADHYLGGLIDALRELGVYEKTAILVTSDHGEEFLEHGGVGHGFGKVFDENVRVPMIYKPPGRVEPAVSSAPVNGVDVVPTLLAAAGVAAPPGTTGRAVQELILEEGGASPGASPSGNRAILVHGLNSFPEVHEERYRLDAAELALVWDRVREQVVIYDRKGDPGMLHPGPVETQELVVRLETVLAWTSAEGRAFARLPAGIDSFMIPPDSTIRPIGTWRALEWTSGDVANPLRPERVGGPSVLVFDVEPKAGGRLLLGIPREGQVEEKILGPFRAVGPAWSPLAGALPAPFVAVPTARAYRSRRVVPDETESEELRSLGYVK